MVYVTATGEDAAALGYAFDDDGFWMTDTWGGGFAFGFGGLIAVPDGSVRAVYTQIEGDAIVAGPLGYLSNASGDFVSETVDPDVECNLSVVARSANGHVHVAYSSARTQLFYAHRCE